MISNSRFFFSVYSRIVPGAERATSKDMARSIVAVVYRRASQVCSTSHRAVRKEPGVKVFWCKYKRILWFFAAHQTVGGAV